MRIYYKNETGKPLNVAGFRFGVGRVLESNIVFERFSEAVEKGELSMSTSKDEVTSTQEVPTPPVQESKKRKKDIPASVKEEEEVKEIEETTEKEDIEKPADEEAAIVIENSNSETTPTE